MRPHSGCRPAANQPTLVLPASVVHFNLRMVRKWAKRIGFQSDDILLARDRAIAGYEEIPLDDDEPPAALSPPTAA
ncbi:hypothetical protein Cph01nite_36990 [Cellulomonas phragmiteti]|uniref:Uncharacterized protein n=2 Tax=Cellulomonas TaxID=1707 RepID=A0ABQ4DRF8_9CELL|nr:hypothetical protein Cph01nite_36990 [Cellulomonas phragmiteti]